MTNNYRHTLFRDGTSQQQRFPKALHPNYVRLDERNIEQLLEYVHELAEHIKFYTTENAQELENWLPFFENIRTKKDRQQLILSWGKEQDQKPHLALLFAFLKLFEEVQQQLNLLKEKHLDFYYKEILRLLPRSAQPNQVHVLFELAKHVKEHRIPSGTILQAETKNGQIEYKTENELIANQASIEQLKTVFVEKQEDEMDGEINGIFRTPIIQGEGSWSAFGESQLGKSLSNRTMQDAEVGFAIASPILFLAEGTRTITLTLNLQIPKLNGQEEVENNKDILDGAISRGFDFYLSGEEIWLKPSIKWIDPIFIEDNSWKINIDLEIDQSMPAIVGFNSELLEGRFDAEWPVLKVVFNNRSSVYELLQNSRIANINIQVKADNVRDLFIQNDQMVLDSSKPFFPFTTQPRIGSTLNIFSKEAFQKRLNYLNIRINWADLPVSFATYYTEYKVTPTIVDDSFKYDVKSVIKGKVSSLPSSGSDYTIKEQSQNIAIDSPERTTPLDELSFQRNSDLNEIESINTRRDIGFIKATLNAPKEADFTAFGHKEFPKLFTAGALAPDGPEILNPPYTPKVQSLWIDYESYETMDFYSGKEGDQFFHLTPFGHHEIKNQNNFLLLPKFNEQGYLYIGLDKVEALQTVSFLFQVEDGTNDPNIGVLPQDLKWSCLSKNQWLDLKPSEVLIDSTHQLKSSGIIALQIPEKATNQNHMMEEGLYWLRLSLAKNPKGVCRINEIITNATLATQIIPEVQSDQNALSNLNASLPPDSITKLTRSQSQIKSIKQPYPSFGGKAREQQNEYNTRASERLRHKNRAIAIWDYEHLILEAFPEVHKVKCLPIGTSIGTTVSEDIKLIVIPNFRNLNTTNFLEPKASSILLSQIEKHVAPFTTPFIRNRISAQHPVYESVVVHCKVSLKEGYDPGYYTSQLNDALIQYLSPWAFDKMEDIHFGSVIYASEVVDFVDQLPYVELVYEMKLYHVHGKAREKLSIGSMIIAEDFMVGELADGIGCYTIGEDFVIGEPIELIVPTQPDSILVSHDFHYVEVISVEGIFCEPELICKEESK